MEDHPIYEPIIEVDREKADKSPKLYKGVTEPPAWYVKEIKDIIHPKKRHRAPSHKKAYKRAKAQARRAELAAKGLCWKCVEENDRPDKTTCSKCAEIERVKRVALNNRRIDRNECISCGKDKDEDGYFLCPKCRTERRAKYQAAKTHHSP